MSAPAAVAPPLLARARADQVATLYARWHLTSLSMVLGALILCAVMWDHVAPAAVVVWLAADRVEPGVARSARPRVAPRAARHRGRAALGPLLGGRLHGRRRAVGTRRVGDRFPRRRRTRRC